MSHLKKTKSEWDSKIGLRQDTVGESSSTRERESDSKAKERGSNRYSQAFLLTFWVDVPNQPIHLRALRTQAPDGLWHPETDYPRATILDRDAAMHEMRQHFKYQRWDSLQTSVEVRAEDISRAVSDVLTKLQEKGSPRWDPEEIFEKFDASLSPTSEGTSKLTRVSRNKLGEIILDALLRTSSRVKIDGSIRPEGIHEDDQLQFSLQNLTEEDLTADGALSTYVESRSKDWKVDDVAQFKHEWSLFEVSDMASSFAEMYPQAGGLDPRLDGRDENGAEEGKGSDPSMQSNFSRGRDTAKSKKANLLSQTGLSRLFSRRKGK